MTHSVRRVQRVEAATAEVIRFVHDGSRITEPQHTRCAKSYPPSCQSQLISRPFPSSPNPFNPSALLRPTPPAHCLHPLSCLPVKLGRLVSTPCVNHILYRFNDYGLTGLSSSPDTMHKVTLNSSTSPTHLRQLFFHHPQPYVLQEPFKQRLSRSQLVLLHKTARCLLRLSHQPQL